MTNDQFERRLVKNGFRFLPACMRGTAKPVAVLDGRRGSDPGKYKDFKQFLGRYQMDNEGVWAAEDRLRGRSRAAPARRKM